MKTPQNPFRKVRQEPAAPSGERRAPKGLRWRPGRLALLVMAVVAAAVAFALRGFRLGVSWEIFVDEITYVNISQSVAERLEVTLFGDPFYLHPPLFFFLEGAYLALVGSAGGMVDQIYDARYLNAVLAGLTAAVLFGIGRRLAGWPVGVAVAAIFALDPFVMKMNSRNLMETSAMLWVLLGYYVLFRALAPASSGRLEGSPVSAWRAAAAGVLFGLALLTKDLTAFLTLLPLGVCFALNWAVPRRLSFIAGAAAVAIYLPYPLVVWAIGDWGDYFYQKTRGASRLAGLFHETGFNQQGGPSFFQTLIENLNEFATSYALLGAGAVSVLVLLLLGERTRVRRLFLSRVASGQLVLFLVGERTPARRLFLAWVACAYSLLAYVVVLGALEEQLFYYLIVPAILATVLAIDLVLSRGVAGAQARRKLLGATTVLAAALVVWNGYIWTQVHITPDNGYDRVVAYIDESVPESSNIGVTNDTAQFLLGERAMKYSTPEELQQNDVEYVVTSSFLTEQGYSEATPEFDDYVESEGELVYGFQGRSFGFTGVYELPESSSE